MCTVMTLICRHFIESVLSFCMVSCFGKLNPANKNMLSWLVKVASKVYWDESDMNTVDKTSVSSVA